MSKYRMIRNSLQHRFQASRAKIQFYGGGFGNGKSAGACIKAIRLALNYPGSNGLIARETYSKVNDTIRKEFYKWLPKSTVKRWPTQQDNTMIFNNGSVINFRYVAQRGKKASDGQTTSNLLSATYDWIVIDQIEDPMIQYKDFIDLMGRLRGSTPYKGNDPTMPATGPRFLILTSNPTGNWVYRKLVKPLLTYNNTGVVTDELIIDPKTNMPLMELFEGSTYENAHNLPEDFIEGQEAVYKGQMRDRFLLGKWAAYEGLVYPMYQQKTHMIPKEHMLNILTRDTYSKTLYQNVAAYDHGISSPCCFLFGFTDEIGRIFVIDGFYKKFTFIADIGAAIRDIQDKYKSFIDIDDEPIWGDPAIFKQRVIEGKVVSTLGKIFNEQQELYVKPAQNDITSGIMKVSSYMSIIENMHYQDINKAGPMLYFSDELTFLDEEFTDYFWTTNDTGERTDKPMDRNDHGMDTVKYMLTKVPEVTKLIYRKPIITPEFLRWHEIN